MPLFRRKNHRKKNAKPLHSFSVEQRERVKKIESYLAHDIAVRHWRDIRQKAKIEKLVKKDMETYKFPGEHQCFEQYNRAMQILNLRKVRHGVRFAGAFNMNGKKLGYAGTGKTLKGYELNLNPFKKAAWKALWSYYKRTHGEEKPDLAYWICVFPVTTVWRTIVLPLSIGGRLMARAMTHRHLSKEIRVLEKAAKEAEKNGKTIPLALFVAHIEDLEKDGLNKTEEYFKKLAFPKEKEKKKKKSA